MFDNVLIDPLVPWLFVTDEVHLNSQLNFLKDL